MVEGGLQKGQALLGRVSEVAMKKKVFLTSDAMCQIVMKYAIEGFGGCPGIMVTTESSGLLMTAIYLTRNMPRPLRERIGLA